MPSGLTLVEFLLGLEVLKRVMVGEDLEVFDVFKVEAPSGEAVNDGEEFLFADGVVAFGGSELARLEGDRVPSMVELLLEDAADAEVGRVRRDANWKVGSEDATDWG